MDLESWLASASEDRGIDRSYRHQAEMAGVIHDGDNVVLTMRATSGKSLAYTVSAFERAMDHGGRMLYLGLQNTFVVDQLDTPSNFACGLGFGSRIPAGQYAGWLSKSEKRKVRRRMPMVLLSNPNMAHYVLLPHAHRLWEWFFPSLEMVVIDEVHGYRRVLGSHVALLIRQLKCVYEWPGADPQFVCCLAIIGNPVEYAVRIMSE